MDIEELRNKNSEALERLRAMGLNEDEAELKAQMLIKNILENDDIFYKMKMNESLNIIKLLYPESEDEDLLQIYNELIIPKKFKSNEER